MFNKRDIVVVHFAFSDNSHSKLRPALVVSSDKVNKTGDTIVVQITSKRKADGLNLEIADADLTAPLPLKSFI